MRYYDQMLKWYKEENELMTKKDLEGKLFDAEKKLDEALGLNEIYKGGITKKELKVFAAKYAALGLAVGLLVGWMFL